MNAAAPAILLRRWLKRSRESQLSHYAAAESFSKLHYRIGIPAVACSTIVGTTVFATLDSNERLEFAFRSLIGAFSILTAILAACQTFLKFSERADLHRNAAVKYSALRREIEARLSLPAAISSDQIDRIRKTFDHITSSAPNVPANIWTKTVAQAGTDYLGAEDAKAVAPATLSLRNSESDYIVERR